MAYTLRKSSNALLVTSSTTCMAFIANGFSKLLQIRAFGVYAAIIVFVNYIFVIFLFPPMVFLQEKYLSNRSIFCRKKKIEENEN
jgi:predicted RND superfamily exporter protein